MTDLLPPPPVPGDANFVNDGTVVHICAECGGPMRYDTDYFMLTHPVWAKAIGAHHRKKWAPGYLHLACVEKRLGRPLVLADFMPSLPINCGFFGFDAQVYVEKRTA